MYPKLLVLRLNFASAKNKGVVSNSDLTSAQARAATVDALVQGYLGHEADTIHQPRSENL
jgi:hypothetical protein